MQLSSRYNPYNYPKETKEEIIRYKIMHMIHHEINDILSDLESNEENPKKLEQKMEDIKYHKSIKLKHKIEEMNNPWKEEIINKLKSINSAFILKKEYKENYLDLLKNENVIHKKEYLSEIIYKPGYKLESYKILKYFIQISIGLFHLKLKHITITNFSLKNIILDNEDNIKFDLTEKNFSDKEEENPDKLDTLYLGFFLFELLFLKKVNRCNLEQIIKDFESKDFYKNNYSGIQLSQELLDLFFSNNGQQESILENLLCHFDKRYSLSKLFSSDNFLALFENNMYNEIKKGNIKSKLFYFNY